MKHLVAVSVGTTVAFVLVVLALVLLVYVYRRSRKRHVLCEETSPRGSDCSELYTISSDDMSNRGYGAGDSASSASWTNQKANTNTENPLSDPLITKADASPIAGPSTAAASGAAAAPRRRYPPLMNMRLTPVELGGVTQEETSTENPGKREAASTCSVQKQSQVQDCLLVVEEASSVHLGGCQGDSVVHYSSSSSTLDDGQGDDTDDEQHHLTQPPSTSSHCTSYDNRITDGDSHDTAAGSRLQVVDLTDSTFMELQEAAVLNDRLDTQGVIPSRNPESHAIEENPWCTTQLLPSENTVEFPMEWPSDEKSDADSLVLGRDPFGKDYSSCDWPLDGDLDQRLIAYLEKALNQADDSAS